MPENRDALIARLRESIAAEGGNFLEFHRLGILLRQAGDLAAALEAQDAALARNPKLGAAHFQRGLLLKETGRTPEAITALRTAVSLNHRTPLAFQMLGLLLNGIGDVAGASEAFEQAIALNDKLPDLHFRLGLAYRDLGDIDRAVDKIRDAIALKDDVAPYHIQLGVLLKLQKNPLAAAEALRRAIELSPGLPTPYFQLSILLRASGRMDEALDMVGMAIERKRDIPQYHLQRMTLLLDKGDVTRAKRVLKDVSRINPALARARKPDIELRSLLTEGKVAIIPAGFRCFTKGIIKERLRFLQPSLPFDAGFFTPRSIVSVLRDPCVRLAHQDGPKNYAVCVKQEQYLDPVRGLGIWFRRSSYQDIDENVTSVSGWAMNPYLDTALCYYTLDERHEFVLAHYNWHKLACAANPQRIADPAYNIPAINDMLNRRIQRMFEMCRSAEHIFFVSAETQSYTFMKLDDVVYDLGDLSEVIDTAQTLFPARAYALDVNDLRGPETLLEIIRAQEK